MKEKLRKLGYREYKTILDTTEYRKHYSGVGYLALVLTSDNRIVGSYIITTHRYFEKQVEIDDLQIAFNNVKRDMKELCE